MHEYFFVSEEIGYFPIEFDSPRRKEALGHEPQKEYVRNSPIYRSARILLENGANPNVRTQYGVSGEA